MIPQYCATQALKLQKHGLDAQHAQNDPTANVNAKIDMAKSMDSTNETATHPHLTSHQNATMKFTNMFQHSKSHKLKHKKKMMPCDRECNVAESAM